MMSRETYVNYTMPLGLNHIMNYDTHNGPEPWHDDPVWTAFDYHKITKDSIGVNRTAKGTGATGQYHNPVGEIFDDIKQCPQEYLLWFHRVPWNYKMASGRNLWDELVYHYYKGVDEVRQIASCSWYFNKDATCSKRSRSILPSSSFHIVCICRTSSTPL